jgi:hypothetical protein
MKRSRQRHDVDRFGFLCDVGDFQQRNLVQSSYYLSSLFQRFRLQEVDKVFCSLRLHDIQVDQLLVDDIRRQKDISIEEACGRSR